jgi:hypothetical protein
MRLVPAFRQAKDQRCFLVRAALVKRGGPALHRARRARILVKVNG